MIRKLLFLLALSVVVIIIAYSLSRWQFNWPLFLSSLWRVQPWWLLASIAVTGVTYVIRAYRWQVLLSPIKHISIRPLLVTTLVGFSAIYVLGRPAEIARPVLLARREGFPLTASVATIIVERVFDFIIMIALFAWALVSVQVSPDSAASLALMKKAAWWIIGGSMGAVLAFIVFHSNLERVLRFIPGKRLKSMVQSFAQGLTFLGNGKSLALVLFHSIALWIAIALQFWFMLLGMRFELSLEASTIVLVGTAVASIAQIPGIGGGFQAGFAFCLATFFRVPAEQAIAASLIAFFFSYVPTIAITAAYMAAQGMHFRDLKGVIRGPQSENV